MYKKNWGLCVFFTKLCCWRFCLATLCMNVPATEHIEVKCLLVKFFVQCWSPHCRVQKWSTVAKDQIEYHRRSQMEVALQRTQNRNAPKKVDWILHRKLVLLEHLVVLINGTISTNYSVHCTLYCTIIVLQCVLCVKCVAGHANQAQISTWGQLRSDDVNMLLEWTWVDANLTFSNQHFS